MKVEDDLDDEGYKVNGTKRIPLWEIIPKSSPPRPPTHKSNRGGTKTTEESKEDDDETRPGKGKNFMRRKFEGSCWRLLLTDYS